MKENNISELQILKTYLRNQVLSDTVPHLPFPYCPWRQRSPARAGQEMTLKNHELEKSSDPIGEEIQYKLSAETL